MRLCEHLLKGRRRQDLTDHHVVEYSRPNLQLTSKLIDSIAKAISMIVIGTMYGELFATVKAAVVLLSFCPYRRKLIQ